MRSFAVVALAAVASAKVLSTNDFNFVNYISKFGKQYSTLEEYNLRFNRFMDIEAQIKQKGRVAREEWIE